MNNYSFSFEAITHTRIFPSKILIAHPLIYQVPRFNTKVYRLFLVPFFANGTLRTSASASKEQQLCRGDVRSHRSSQGVRRRSTRP